MKRTIHHSDGRGRYPENRPLPPRGQRTAAGGARSGVDPRDPRKPLQLRIRLLTGGSPWVEVEAPDGSVTRFHGITSVVEVVMWASGWSRG